MKIAYTIKLAGIVFAFVAFLLISFILHLCMDKSGEVIEAAVSGIFCLKLFNYVVMLLFT